MYNILLNGTPDSYKGFKLNTDYRVSLRIQNLLEDPRLNRSSHTELMAAYMVAFSLLYADEDIVPDKLSFNDALEGLFWWLSCGNNDSVENYWKRTGIMPDVDDNAFDYKDYSTPESDMITVDKVQIDGTTKQVSVTKYSILSFTAPDGTTRYAKQFNGERDILSLYEDSALIYSGFYKVFNIDLAKTELHWFTFCYLLSELECTENTALRDKIKIRAFNPDNYKGKQYKDYCNKMKQAQNESKVIGILPYIDRGD